MGDNVTISYRGARYELGRGPRFYGIWAAGAPRSQPLEWWPETPEGWSGAWSRFTSVEEPGTIAPVSQPAPPAAVTGAPRLAAKAGPRGLTAAAVLAAGIACGIAGLFPAYSGGLSIAHEPYELVAHLIYLAAWAASAALICQGGSRLRAGALLGIGTSVVTFGLFFADLGTVIAGASMGAGLVLSLLGWLVCTAGAAAAFRPREGLARALHRADAGPAVMLALAALGTAAAFAPAWDSYTLRTAAGAVRSATAGNAFANPAPVIAGNVAVMVALVAAVLAAALWRPAREGAALLAGAIIPMLAQAISAAVQVAEATPPSAFGISPAEATALGLRISNGLTPAFWIYCVFLAALVLAWARTFTLPGEAAADDTRVPTATTTTTVG